MQFSHYMSSSLKIITIGDIHGLKSWKSVQANVMEYDHIIFIGDYVDDYDIPGREILVNLKEIVAFKSKYPDRVKLLIGNHDMQYIMNERQSSGYNDTLAETYHEIFNSTQLDIAFQIGSHLWTHAGINTVWANKHLNRVPKEEIANTLNCMNATESGRRKLLEVGPRRGGLNDTGGPLWCDYTEIKAHPYPGMHQVIGHTPVPEIETIEGEDYSLVNCNCLPIVEDFYEMEL